MVADQSRHELNIFKFCTQLGRGMQSKIHATTLHGFQRPIDVKGKQKSQFLKFGLDWHGSNLQKSPHGLARMKKPGFDCPFRTTNQRCDLGKWALFKIAKPDDFTVFRAQSFKHAAKFKRLNIFFGFELRRPVTHAVVPLDLVGTCQWSTGRTTNVVYGLVAHDVQKPTFGTSPVFKPSSLLPDGDKGVVNDIFCSRPVAGKKPCCVVQQSRLLASVKRRKCSLIPSRDPSDRPLDVNRHLTSPPG